MRYLVMLALVNKALKKEYGGYIGKKKSTGNSYQDKEMAFYEQTIADNNRSRNREVDFMKAVRFAVGYDNDEVLKSFFDDIHEYGKKIDYIDAKEYIDRSKNLEIKTKKSINDVVSKIDELLAEIIDIGIDYGLGEIFEGVDIKLIYGNYRFSFYDDPTQSNEITNLRYPIDLRIENISIFDINEKTRQIDGLDLKIEKTTKFILELEQKEEELNERLLKLEKKRIVFNRDGIEEEKKIINDELTRIRREKRDSQFLLQQRKKAKKFVSLLSEKQFEIIKMIKECLLEIKKIESNKENVDLLFDTISAIYGYSPYRKVGSFGAFIPTNNSERKRIERIIEMMEKDGKLSEERIANIINSFNNVNEKIDAGYYQEKIWMYNEWKYLDQTEENEKEMVEFFSLVNSNDFDLIDISETLNQRKK